MHAPSLGADDVTTSRESFGLFSTVTASGWRFRRVISVIDRSSLGRRSQTERLDRVSLG